MKSPFSSVVAVYVFPLPVFSLNVIFTSFIPFSPSLYLPSPSLTCPTFRSSPPLIESKNTLPVNSLASANSNFNDGLESVSSSYVDLSPGIAFPGFESTSTPARTYRFPLSSLPNVVYEFISTTLSNVV